ncbi:MAG: DUF308 domain-containing protein [Fretibacterium sp.]|nr:DUF308 domain-containing protein [Fretibacterium sp.]
MGSMKKLRWTLYITGGILILLGLWTLRYPVEALLSLAFFLGLGFCLSGVNYIVPCLFRRGECVYPWWFLIFGILDLITGAVMLGRIGLTAFMLPLFVAAWLIFAGIARILTSFRLRRLALPRWWLMLLNGVAVILLGCLMTASPLVGGLSVVMALAGSLIAKGLLVIMEGRVVFSERE